MYARGETFVMPWIREPVDAHDSSDQNTGEGADDHDSGQGPYHAPFPPVAVNPAGNGHNIEHLVGGAHRRMGVVQKGHLKRQQQKSA